MGFLRALYRFCTFVTTCVSALVALAFRKWITGKDIQKGLEARQRWINFILDVLGVVVEVKGELPQQPALFVSNHRSYIDPLPVLKDVQAFPVAKAEVEKWPIIGYGSSETGILWVNRSQKESRKSTRQRVVETIQQRHFHTLIYPEGTTHKQPNTIAFRRGIFEEAAKHGITVIPVAIDYQDPKDAWVGDDTFIRHFFECFAKPKTYVKLWYGQPLQNSDPEELIQQAKEWIDTHLLIIQDSWKTTSPVAQRS